MEARLTVTAVGPLHLGHCASCTPGHLSDKGLNLVHACPPPQCHRRTLIEVPGTWASCEPRRVERT